MKFKVWDSEYKNFVKESLLREFFIRPDGQLAIWEPQRNTMREVTFNEFMPVFSTGKTDKNGVELFDKDRVKTPEGREYTLVIRNSVLTFYSNLSKCHNPLYHFVSDKLDDNALRIEKIGSSLENPELTE